MKNLNLKKFSVYLDDGKYCYKVAVPAANKTEAEKYVEGNGEVIAVKDITEDFPISLDKISKALVAHEFGAIEIDLILRTLQMTNIAE